VDDILKTAIALLKSGAIIVAPTDTVYGLLADATNDSAILKIYALKQRPITKPLIVLISSIAMAGELATFSKEDEKILKYFWMEKKLPLTVVLKVKNISKLVTAGNDTVALRVPNHELSLKLIKHLGKPIVAPSANISGMEPTTDYETVKNNFNGKIPLIINGKSCKNAKPSTILDLSKKEPTVIREGTVSFDEINKFIKHSQHF
jgi:L-threonylcarbamoyladenylate synthase